jgi:hypothetical protein
MWLVFCAGLVIFDFESFAGGDLVSYGLVILILVGCTAMEIFLRRIDFPVVVTDLVTGIIVETRKCSLAFAIQDVDRVLQQGENSLVFCGTNIRLTSRHAAYDKLMRLLPSNSGERI